MCENTSDFSGVKVGDKLWSVQLGECEVANVDNKDCTFKCEDTNNNLNMWYRRDGTSYDITGPSAHQQLFWSRPDIIAPPRPKRKVVKTVEAWINIYPEDVPRFAHKTRDEADSARELNRIACVHLTGSYEVFE